MHDIYSELIDEDNNIKINQSILTFPAYGGNIFQRDSMRENETTLLCSYEIS